MKTLLLILTGIFLSVSAVAQTVNIHFTGTNKTRNFQAVFNSISYYSNSTAAAGGKKITINNLQPGAHKLIIYRTNNNRYTSGVSGASTAGTPVYSKTFQLRTGYDMNIAVRGTGQVSFTEKRNATPIPLATPMPMSETAYNTLLTNVRAKWSQSSRITTIRTAIGTKSNYFTTDQLGQLLTLVTSEASRLELAKLAFPKVTDQTMYNDLSELFTSQTHKDNFEAFLQKSIPGYTGTGNTTPAPPVPMATDPFNQLLNNVRTQWSQSSKTATIKSAFSTSTNYFTTNQIGQLLSQISSEGSRLELAKLIYPRATDKSDFRELSELFTTASIRSDFETFIGITPTGNNAGWTDYGNRAPVSDNTFTSLLQTVNNQYGQGGKIAVLTDALNNTSYFFTTAQLRQLITPVTAEADRLALLKLSYSRVADIASFNSLNDLLYNQSSRAELESHVRTGGVVNSNYANRIAISDAEFSRLEFKARLHFRQSSTVEDLQEAFRSTTAYYSVAQIRQLLLLVTTETDRLSLAKLAFHRVTDPTGYKQLDDLFTTQASRDELARYIAANWF